MKTTKMDNEKYTWRIWKCRICEKFIADKVQYPIRSKFEAIVDGNGHKNCIDLKEGEQAVIDLIKLSPVKPDYVVDYIDLNQK